MDFATRAYNHGFPFDPIVRSLIDTALSELLTQQFIATPAVEEAETAVDLAQGAVARPRRTLLT